MICLVKAKHLEFTTLPSFYGPLGVSGQKGALERVDEHLIFTRAKMLPEYTGRGHPAP